MYEVVWPQGKKVAKIMRFAKRLDSLQGKTVCELWDWIFRGDEVFPALEKEFARRYPGIKFVTYDVFGSTHGGGEAEVLASLPDKLKQHRCDAVISAVGC